MISNMVTKSDVGAISFGADGAGPHAAGVDAVAVQFTDHRKELGMSRAVG